MSSSRGVLQGYNGLAVVDDRAQIVVHAEAHGSGYEGHLLAPIIEATRKTFGAMERGRDVFRRAKVTADSGFHSKTVVDAVEQTGADVYIADRYYRQREPAFANATRHKERVKKERALLRRKKREARPEEKRRLFTLQDFSYDESTAQCFCPAGHKLYQSGKDMLFNGYRVAHFKAPITACRDCPLRAQCLRYPDRTIQRQLMVIKHHEGVPKSRARKHAPTERMRWKFGSPAGQPPHANCRTRLRQPAKQGHAALHPPRQAEGKRPVAALHHRPQHREDRASRSAAVSQRDAHKVSPGASGPTSPASIAP